MVETKSRRHDKESKVGTPTETSGEKEVQVKKPKVVDFKLDIEGMARAGLQFGHKTSKCHPKMKPYLAGTRSTVSIIDLLRTKEKFEEALKFIQTLIGENKILLLVGTKIQAKVMVEETAKECGLPYVKDRWLGGTFTNFETILKRIQYFNDLEKKIKEGELAKYTKKERALFDRELEMLKKKFGGVRGLTKLPDAIFVLDMREDELAVKEARRRGIKIIGVADTNVDLTLADFPIPANDDATSSIKYILEKVKEIILKTKEKQILTQPFA